MIRLFGFFALVLVGLVWINRSVALIDRLLGDGQSVGIFLQMSLLALPNIVAIALPLAAFAAGMVMANRMIGDSEMIAARAVGLSPLRLTRAPLAFGLIAFAFMSMLAHVLSPASAIRQSALEAEIARNQTARLLTPGTFTNVDALGTLYFSGFESPSVLQNVFLEDTRDPQTHVLHTAPRARLAHRASNPDRSAPENDATVAKAERVSDTVLILENGTSQSLDTETGRLIVAHYAQAQYGLNLNIDALEERGRKIEMVSTPDLLTATPELQDEIRASEYRLRAAAHIRFSQAALSLLAAALGFMPLLMGGHSRLGNTPQIALGIFLVLVVMASDSTGRTLARSSEHPFGWLAAYTSPGIALICLVAMATVLQWPGRARRSSGRNSNSGSDNSKKGSAPC